jgi:phosphotriesterase-related protein
MLLCRAMTITRREAIGMLGIGAAAGMAGKFAGPLAAQTPPRITFPKGAIIRTILRDLPPEELASGATLFHEHLSMRYPPGATTHFTDDVALMVEEAKLTKADGVAAIVDGGHADMNRSIDALKRISTESGLPIIVSGGYYMQRTYPAEIATKSADQIAEELAKEAAASRFGAFGEIGQQGGVLTDDERKVFTAVAKAHAKTGLPIFTHNAYTGTRPTQNPVPKDTAIKQLDLLLANGVKPQNLAIGHVCCLDDVKAEIPIEIAKRGAYVGFDRVTIALVPDAQKVTTIMAIVDAGFASKILLASDFSNARGLKKNGGGGLGQAVTVFAPMLLKAGMPEATLKMILNDNPRQFLAFGPVA